MSNLIDYYNKEIRLANIKDAFFTHQQRFLSLLGKKGCDKERERLDYCKFFNSREDKLNQRYKTD